MNVRVKVDGGLFRFIHPSDTSALTLEHQDGGASGFPLILLALQISGG